MVEAAERDGVLTPESILIESSSGNLGVALSMLAASKGYRFLCVTDFRNLATMRLMEALGSQVHVVAAEPDAKGGLLGARLDYVRRRCASDDQYVWLNQYTHSGNWGALPQDRAGDRAPVPRPGRAVRGGGDHRDPDGLRALPAGVAPAGARRRRGQRRLGDLWSSWPSHDPGTGRERRSAAARRVCVDDVVLVEEADTIRACHRLARRGFLFGGSTGTVVSGAMDWLARHDEPELTAVAIAPDLGERYLDTVYQPDWCASSTARTCSSPTSRRTPTTRRPWAPRRWPPARGRLDPRDGRGRPPAAGGSARSGDDALGHLGNAQPRDLVGGRDGRAAWRDQRSVPDPRRVAASVEVELDPPRRPGRAHGDRCERHRHPVPSCLTTASLAVQ